MIRPVGKDTQEQTNYVIGFQKGLNALQNESLIDDHELSVSINSMLTVDSIQKRSGSANFGSSSGTRIYGGSPFYTSATSNNRWIIRAGTGTALQYYNGSNVPTDITGATMTGSLRTEFAMARDTLYAVNGTDPLTRISISGGVPVAAQNTTLTTPTNLVITPTGTTGSTTYSYRVSAFNTIGETIACVSVTTTTGNATLTSTNYNALTWTAVTGATGYIVYGNKGVAQNGLGETKMKTVTTNSYNDTGVDTPSTTILPQDGNTTIGPAGTMIAYAMGRLFVAGDVNNPSRLYYSVGGTEINDFSSAYGGGTIDVNKNDGDSITAIYYFLNKLVVFKHRSIWQFQFTNGVVDLQLITNEVGCESQRTVRIVNNDLWFVGKKDGKAVVYSYGYVANYNNAARTTEQSLKISGGSLLDAANVTYLGNACSYFFRNLYIVCLAGAGSTTNDTCFVFDVRFGCWVAKWTGINANCFFSYQDSLGNEELYYGSETTGYIVKMFTGTDDNGTAISWQIQTKNFNQKLFDQYKSYRNPIFWFKDVSGGNITGYIINDGIFNSGQFSISALISGIGFGYDRWGTIKFGTSAGASTSSTTSDQPMEIIFSKIARSVKFELDESSSSGSFKLLGLSFKWLLLEGKPLPSTNRIRLTS